MSDKSHEDPMIPRDLVPRQQSEDPVLEGAADAGDQASDSSAEGDIDDDGAER